MMRVLSILCLGLLTACQEPVDTAARERAEDSVEATAREQYPLGLGCGWEFASNIDTMNVAFPDESAKYWVAMVPMLPNTRLRIDGRYPDARYFSYNVYDPIIRPSDAIADADLLPADGDINPFARHTVLNAEGLVEPAPWGGSYTAYVEFTAKPDQPAPNTVYAGEFQVGGNGVPQPALTALMYRVYVPGEGQDFDGGVGLPLLTLETADGEIELLPMADCVEPLLPTLGNTVTQLGLNELLLGVDVVDDPFLQLPESARPGNPDAPSTVFYGLPTTVVNLLRGYLGLPVPEGIESNFPSGGGFLSNIHNAYTSNLFSRQFGNIALIRGKAPSFRGQDGVPFATEQMRYWSVCQNDLPTTRFVACLADHQIHLDEDGYFTILVSDAADRPANATVENGIEWLPWGPYATGTVIYRHMLPNEGFAETIHNVPSGTAPADIMGEYLPIAAHCQRDIVEAAGNRAADVFAACREYTDGLSAILH